MLSLLILSAMCVCWGVAYSSYVFVCVCRQVVTNVCEQCLLYFLARLPVFGEI